MKKTIAMLLIVAATASMMSVSAFAHGGHGSGRHARQQTQYEVCSLEGCDQYGLHQHDGDYYYCANHGAGCHNSWS